MHTGFKILPVMVMLLLSLVFAPAAHAALATVGPVDPATTFPAYYQDTTGLSLAPCLDQNGFCTATMLSLPTPTAPVVWPTNFPAEGFYFLADNIFGTARYRAALEFSGGPGAQITFARIRITDKTAPLGTYTVTHPYGVFTATVDAVNVARNQGLRFTEDLGLGGPPFTGALAGKIGPFLRTATGLVTSPDGNIYVGNSVTPVAVTGTPVTSVSVVPALAGSPSSLFSLEGKVIGMGIAPPSIDFGTIGGNPAITAPITVTVTNLSSAGTLTVGSLVPGGTDPTFFKVTDVNCLTAPIGPAGTCTFTVAFGDPTVPSLPAVTPRTGSITVNATLATVPKVVVTPLTGVIDALPPSIIATFPTTTSAPSNVNITFTFDKSMNPTTINATTFTVLAGGVQIPGLALPVYNDANKIASVALPAAQEQALVGSIITVQATAGATGMKDVVGNALASAVTFSFTAAAPDHVAPTIASLSPAANAIGVRTDGKITVTFSEPMLATSITASVVKLALATGGVAVDGTVTVDGAVATFNPAQPLEFGTAYTLTVTSDAKDLASNLLTAGQTINFVTNSRPSVPNVISPDDGSTGVARPVILRWAPSSDQDLQPIEYHVFLCNNQAFIGSEPDCILNKTVTTTTARAKGVYYASVAGGGMLFSLFGLGFAAGLKGRKRILTMIAVLFISGLFIVSCGGGGGGGGPVSTDITFQVDNLHGNVKYFWKVEANDGNGGVAATSVQEFTTAP